MNPAKEFKVIIPGKQSNTPKLDIGKFPCEFSKAPNSTLKIVNIYIYICENGIGET